MRNFYCALLVLLFTAAESFAQPITVTAVVRQGRFSNTYTPNGCNVNLGNPVVTMTRTAGAGSFVNASGALVCTDPCDSTTIAFTITNIRWTKGGDDNWLHGVEFCPTGQSAVPGAQSLGATWLYRPFIQGPICGPGGAPIPAGKGFYYDGTAGQSCCPGITANNNIPEDNYGDVTIDCNRSFSVSWTQRFCNGTNGLFGVGSTSTLNILGYGDGRTGCWTNDDGSYNAIEWTFNSQRCTPLFSPPGQVPTSTITKNCGPGGTTYTVNATAACSNSATVKWFDALVGGNQIGTGSPLTYTTTTCPGGQTIYADCCPLGVTCATRRGTTLPACPANITLSNPTLTQPTCAQPGGTASTTASNASGTVTYTINPGGTSNTTGTFTNLAPGTYTITGVDAGGCSASTPSFTINPIAGGGGGPAPTVTTPVNYCQNQAASPLTATGTNLLWYTVATGGTGDPNAPTPSTTTVGSTFYYVSQNPTGNCESIRAQIEVIVSANPSITGPGSNNQTVCVNTAMTPIVFTTSGGVTGATASGLPPGLSISYAGGTNGNVTLSGTPTNCTGSPFNYTITTSGGCGGGTSSAAGAITVNCANILSLISGTPSSAQTVCPGVNIANIVYGSGGNVTGISASGLPTGITGNYSGGTNGTFTISGSSNDPAGTYTYTVTTSGGCTVETRTGTITISPVNTITLQSGTNPASVCVTQPLTPAVVYQTGGATTGVTVTGLPATMTATYSTGTNGTVTISGTPTATGPINYTITTTGGSCTQASVSGVINVNPATTITLTSPAGTQNQTVTINTPIATTTYQGGGGATNISITTGSLPAGVNGTYNAGTNVFTISGTPTASGNFCYTLTATGPCGNATINGCITVNDVAVLTLTSGAGSDAQTICINSPLSPNITYQAGGGATNVSVTSGSFPPGITGSYNAATSVYTISGSPTGPAAGGTFNYTLSTSGGVGTASQSGTITVSPAVTLTLTSPPATTNQTICINTAITPITYSTTNGATGVTATPLPAGVTGTFTPGGGGTGTFTISGTPTSTVGSPFNFTVQTTGGCGNDSETGTITVTPAVTITHDATSGAQAQTVCVNTTIVSIVYNTTNGVTGATVTGLPTNMMSAFTPGTGGNGTVTISGTPNVTIGSPFTYNISTTGGCGTATASGTITVNPNVTITQSSAASTTNQTVCVNTAITDVVFQTTNGATGVNVSPALPAGVNGTFVAGAGGTGTYTISGTPTTTAGSPVNYTVTTTGGCSTASLNGSITVTPATTLTLGSAPGTANQTMCVSNAITSIVYNTTNGVTGASAAPLPTGVTGTFTPGAGGNGTFTISGNANSVGTFNYTVTTTGGCGVQTATGSITVNDNVTMTLSSPAGSDAQTVCVNTPLPVNIIYATTNGVTNVTATGFPAGITGTFTPGTGGSGTYTISGTPTTTTGSPFSYNLTTTGGCSSANASGTITVSPAVTLTLTSPPATTNQTICINTAIMPITYSTTNGATGVTATPLPAGVTGTFTPGGGGTGTFTISGTPTSTVGSPFNFTVQTTGGCGNDSETGTITVTPAVTITHDATSGAQAQTVCISTPINNIVYNTANGVTGATVTGLPAGLSGTFAAGTGGNGTVTISGTPTTTTGSPFTYNISTTGGCATATASGTITVNPNVTMTQSSPAATTNQTVCINTAITDVVFQTTNGATGVNVSPALPAGVNGTFVAGAGGTGTYTISGTPTTTAGSPVNYTVTTTGGCSSVSLNGSITVNPAATITLTSAANTSNQTICVNDPITTIQYTVANGVTNVTATGLPTSLTATFSGATNTFTISGNGTPAGTYNYTVTTTGGCGTATATGSIIINDNVTITLSSAAGTNNQTVCINQPIGSIQYTTTNGATGVNVTGLPPGVTGTFSGSTFTINGTPTSAAGSPYNYTVTTVGGCSFATASGSIAVNPAVVLTLTSAGATANQAICEGSAITPITYASANGVTNITVTGLPTGLSAVYSGGTDGTLIISGTPTPPTGIFNYTVTTTGGCATDTETGTINVVAIPAAPIVTSPVLYCPGDAAVPLTATGTNLLWYTQAVGGSGSPVAPTPSTAGPNTFVSYYVSQTTTVAGCESPRAQIDVIVNNPLSVAIGNDTTICQGGSAQFTPVITPAPTAYAWRALDVPNSTISNTAIPNPIITTVDSSRYVLRATYNSCTREDTVMVNVIWKPIVEAGANVGLCIDRSNGVDSILLTASISHTSPAGGYIASYAWTPTDSVSTPNQLSTFVDPTKTTSYTLTMTTTIADYGCDFTSKDSVKVVVNPVVQARAGRDTIGQLNALHQLSATGGQFYQWSSPSGLTINNPNTRTPTVMLTSDANFIVNVQDALGCRGADTIFVKALSGPQYWVPTAFSPNGDGLNDVFRPVPAGISTTTWFRVFNRYGELMFESNQYLKGWDGTIKGKEAPTGNYVWSIKGVDRNRKTVEIQGTVMLIR